MFKYLNKNDRYVKKFKSIMTYLWKVDIKAGNKALESIAKLTLNLNETKIFDDGLKLIICVSYKSLILLKVRIFR